MKNSERTPGLRPLRRVSVFAIQIILATTLAACADSQAPDEDLTSTESAAPDSESSNDLQSNDGSHSASYAPAVAAGDTTKTETPIVVLPATVDVPETGAANPAIDSDVNAYGDSEIETDVDAVSSNSGADETDTDVDLDSVGDTVSDSVNGSEAGADSLVAESDTGEDATQNPFEPVPDAEPEKGESTDEQGDGQDDSNNGPDDAFETIEGDSDTDLIMNEETSADASDGSAYEEASTDDTSTEYDSTDTTDTTEPDDLTTANETSDSDIPHESSSDEDTSSTTSDNSDLAEYNIGAEDSSSLKSKSHTTPGFEGEVLDDAIRVTWNADPLARGYNVYRQAQYITTVMTNEYIDTDVFDRDYYYEIQAFDYDDVLYYIATGLTVSPTTLGKNDPNEAVADRNRLNDYELVFSEEFTGMSLDGSKWNTSYLWGPDLVINREEQYYVDILRDPDFGYNPFTFDGEYMTINSIKTPPELAEKAKNQPYLSGVITSYDAFKFTYGYAETRAKVTFGTGYWPAFWLLNAYYGGYDPEIDIMEFIGSDQDVVYHTYHYYDDDKQLRSTKSKPTPGIDYTADFHTFAVEWKPGTIIYLVDGIEVHRVTDAMVSSEEMYVIANTAIGGWWAGSPDESTPFPGEYTIDYIRVYQRITPFDDVLLNDGMSNLPFADDIPGQSSPSHRPSMDQWPEAYPYR